MRNDFSIELAAGICPAVVGRREELALLRGWRKDPAGLVIVSGEAGVGKTRLLRELAGGEEPRRVPALWARPESVAEPGPFSLMVDLLEGIASQPGTGADEASNLSDELSGVGRSGRDLPARRVAAQVRGVLGLTGARLAVFEDLQRADELSLAVLAHLSRSAASDGTLLIGTYRREDLERNGGLQRLLAALRTDGLVREVELDALRPDEIAEMLRLLWGDDLPGEAAREVERLSEGIPFFVEELARSWRSSGAGVPKSITNSVRVLLDSIDEETRRLVLIASLMKGRLHPAILGGVAESSEDEVGRALIAAVRLGILEDVDGRVSFRHALLRDAIADLWVSVERQRMHRKIAGALEENMSPAGDRWSGSIADHLIAGQDEEAAIPFLLRAAKYALASGALEEARERFRSVLSRKVSGEVKGEALLGMGEVEGRSGNLDEAVVLLRDARGAFVSAGKLQAALKSVHAEAKYLGALVDGRALEALDNGFKLVTDAESLDYAKLIVHKGDLLVRRFQQFSDGAPLLERGRILAERLQSDVLLCEVYEGLAWLAAGGGQVADSVAQGDAAIQLALDVEDEDLIVRTHSNQALRLAHAGEGSRGLDMLESIRLRLIQTGGYMLAPLDHLKAMILWMLGRPSAAEHAAVPLASTRYAREFGRVVRAWAAIERGQEWAALSLVEGWWAELGPTSRSRAAADEDYLVEVASQAVLCELVTTAQSEGPATETALDMFASYHRACLQGSPEVWGLSAALLARVMANEGRFVEASDLLHLFQESVLHQYPLRVGLGLEALALVSSHRGESDAAAGELKEAIELLEGSGNVSDSLRVKRRLAESIIASGGADRILRDQLAECRITAVEVGATREANRIEALLRALGARPRAGRPRGSGLKRGQVSPREEEIIALLATGASNSEIASSLFISEKTVENHIARALKRLEIPGRAGLAAWAAKKGLI